MKSWGEGVQSSDDTKVVLGIILSGVVVIFLKFGLPIVLEMIK
jgi:hypothetical protein